MAPQITDDEIDDLLYFARTGDKEELTTTLLALSTREKVSTAEILANAEDEGKSTCLHMATGNGHLGVFCVPPRLLSIFFKININININTTAHSLTHPPI